MSMFLGPVHYWLYNKIGKQERLTASIASNAEKNGWIEDASIYSKDLSALETVIDEGNIHGWLQGQIADAESRYSSLVSKLLEDDPSRIEELKGLAFDFGKENKVDEALGVQEIYKYFEDFFVNGMPCDHVNQLTEQDENKLAWIMVEDIHKEYWPKGNTEVYYLLRKAVMDGIVDGSMVQVRMEDPFSYVLEVK